MQTVDRGRRPPILALAALLLTAGLVWSVHRSAELEARVEALEARQQAAELGSAAGGDSAPVPVARVGPRSPRPAASPDLPAEDAGAADRRSRDPAGGVEEPAASAPSQALEPLDTEAILEAWEVMRPRIRAQCADHDKGAPPREVVLGLVLDERGGVVRVVAEEEDRPELAACVATFAASLQFPGSGGAAGGVVTLPWGAREP